MHIHTYVHICEQFNVYVDIYTSMYICIVVPLHTMQRATLLRLAPGAAPKCLQKTTKD